MEKLNLSVVSLLLILFLKEALSYLHQYFLLRQSREFNGRIIDFFYQRLMALPKSFFDTRKIGELTTRLNDTTRIQRVITQIVGISVVDTLIVLVTIGFIFSYSPEAGLICMVILPFFYLLVRRYNGKIIYKQRSVMTTFAQVESNYISTLQGIEAIKNFRKQKAFIGLNNLIYRVYQDRLFGLGNFQVRLFFLANAFGISFIMAILVLASHRVMHGQLKPGELIAIIGACSMMLPRLATLAMLSIHVAEARIAFDRMFEFSATYAEKKEPLDVPLYLERIQIKDVAFRFPGGRQLLRQVSLIIRRGEIVVLIGENGSGKSTLAQLLQGHYPVEAGSIFVNEQWRLEDIPLQQWQGVIGLVPPQVHIFNGSVLENVVLDDVTASAGRFLQFVREFEFGPFLDLLPQSFNTLVGEEGINLSGGQKQMIALMRALYHRPQLLVLDEATTAMDRQSEKFVFRLLTSLREKIAVLIITHQLYSLRRVCDRMYIIESGKITGAGDHAGMLKTDNLYSRYWSDLVDR